MACPLHHTLDHSHQQALTVSLQVDSKGKHRATIPEACEIPQHSVTFPTTLSCELVTEVDTVRFIKSTRRYPQVSSCSSVAGILLGTADWLM